MKTLLEFSTSNSWQYDYLQSNSTGKSCFTNKNATLNELKLMLEQEFLALWAKKIRTVKEILRQ